MLENIWQLFSVRKWFDQLLGDTTPKVLCLYLPAWVLPWEHEFVDLLFLHLTRGPVDIPQIQILDLQSAITTHPAPFLALRQQIAGPGAAKVHDMDNLIQHPMAPTMLLVANFSALSPTEQEQWGSLLIRWVRAAQEYDLQRQTLLLCSSSNSVVQHIFQKHEQFIEIVKWSPPYSTIEAQALIETEVKAWTKDLFESLWITHTLVSLCGQDVFCAKEALEQMHHIGELGTVDFWKTCLRQYANKIGTMSPGPMLGVLGFPEPHPVTLLHNHALVERRIWRAQANWLMSCIDEIRWAAQKALGDISREQNRCGEQCSRKRHEFRCLSCIARRRGEIGLANRLKRVQDIRNHLAHYHPVSFDEAKYLWKSLQWFKQ